MQKYNDSILALNKTGHWLDEEETEAVEATFVTKDAEKVVNLLVEYTETVFLAEEACKARRDITKKTYPKKKEREEAEELAKQKLLASEELRQVAYISLKNALGIQEREWDLELEDVWGRATRMGLV